MLQNLLLPIKQIRGEAVHILAFTVLDDFLDEVNTRSMCLADDDTRDLFCAIVDLHSDISDSLGGSMEYMAYNFYTHLLARYNDRNRNEIKKGKYNDSPIFFVAHLLNRYAIEEGNYTPRHRYTMESLDKIIALSRSLTGQADIIRSSFKIAMQISNLAQAGKIQHKGK